MSYQDALKAAGAAVLEFESFGSYQGDWVALVEYKGERGWVQGSQLRSPYLPAPISKCLARRAMPSGGSRS